MIKYTVFIKNSFNDMSCIGIAYQLHNGCICMKFDAIPAPNVEIILVPPERKAEIIPLREVKL